MATQLDILAEAWKAGQGVGVSPRSTNTGSSASGTSTTNSAQTTQNTGTSKQTSQNMDKTSMAALNTLIQQLLGGGTAQMKQQQAERSGEVNYLQNERAGYSKGAAFADSAGLVAQQTRKILEQLLPSINAAAEDAGSSGGALRALLLQDAANKAAESSSALGVQTAAQYGQVSSGLSQVLERLTQVDTSTMNALIGALNVAKGANTSSTTTGNSTQTSTGSSTQNTSSNQNQSQTTGVGGNYSGYTDYAAPIVSRNTAPIYYGPGPEQASGVGGTADTLNQLWGQANPWSNYEI